jgi:hypothetical protein
MANDKKQSGQAQPVLLLNGQPATPEERKRILGARAQRSDPNERATKPLQTVSRPFSILK